MQEENHSVKNVKKRKKKQTNKAQAHFSGEI